MDLNTHKSIQVGLLVEKGIDKGCGRRTLTVVTSTDDPDHDGDVILSTGIKLHKYTKKVLWGHDLGGETLPFGRSLWEKADSGGHKFLQKILAPPFDKMTSNQAQFIGDLWTLYEEGMLNEWSITFGDHTTKGLSNKDIAENPSWKRAKQIISSCDLIEVSAVKVGNNWNTDTIERAAKDLHIDALTFKSLGIVPPTPVIQVSVPEVGLTAETDAPQALAGGLISKSKVDEKEYRDSAGHVVTVNLVDGVAVRHHNDQNFFGGSHGLHSHYIPAEEVWIDDTLAKKEREFVLAHELHERGNMSLGMPYEQAHELADRHEYECRHGKPMPIKQEEVPELVVEELHPKSLEEPEVEETQEVDELPIVELTRKAATEVAVERALYKARGGV